MLFSLLRRPLLSALFAAAGLSAAAPAPAQPPTPPPASDALSYDAAVQLLPESNRAIRLARRALDVSEADIRRADVLPNPTLFGSAGNSTAREYRTKDADWLVRVEQVLERGGKRDLRVAVASGGARAARFDVLEVTRQQRLALAGAYYDLAATQAAATIAEETAAGYQRLAEAAERRQRAGDLAAVDVSRLRVEASRSANEARSARAAVAQAQVALASVLAIEARAAQLRATDELPGAPADGAPADAPLPPPPARIEAAVNGRADVAAAQARLAALEKARELAASQRTRDVTVGVRTERAPQYQGNVVGVDASIPIFLFNDYSGDIARAAAEREQAATELDRIRGQVRADIERAAAQLAAALDRSRRIATATLPEARRAAEAITFAFGRGAATLTDLFDATRQFASVRTEDVFARADLAKALVAYREALAAEESP